jgi:hypothetical protein
VDLNVDPIFQKKRKFRGERYKVIKQEVDKVLVGSFIREMIYPA